ncbi:hypothetical protein [Pseudomonas chlororaphis]|nr:hypothetical protein [Pseudomonas chlororaphis]
MPVLSSEFIKPFGTVVGVIALIVTLFNKYLWSLRVFSGWYVKRPDLRGSWRVELKSGWLVPETGVLIEPVYGYAVVRQTLTSLSLRLMTEESRSVLVAHCIEQQEDEALFKFTAVYRNEPKIELQGVRSEIHHGSFALEVHGCPVYELQGHYWTDRGTKGSMRVFGRVKKLYDTYEQAEAEYRRSEP